MMIIRKAIAGDTPALETLFQVTCQSTFVLRRGTSKYIKLDKFKGFKKTCTKG